MYIYPHKIDNKGHYPLKSDFSVNNQEKEKGYGVYTKKDFKRGSFVARFTGQISHDIVQHSLQTSPDTHLYDPYFSGLLLHSCDPNIVLDMQDFTIWAIKDIDVGDALTMDYASTEDYLFKQFKCLCSSDNCRYWVTGRRESVNEEGSLWLQQNKTDSELLVLKTG